MSTQLELLCVSTLINMILNSSGSLPTVTLKGYRKQVYSLIVSVVDGIFTLKLTKLRMMGILVEELVRHWIILERYLMVC